MAFRELGQKRKNASPSLTFPDSSCGAGLEKLVSALLSSLSASSTALIALTIACLGSISPSNALQKQGSANLKNADNFPVNLS